MGNLCTIHIGCTVGLTLVAPDGCADKRLPSREHRQAQPQVNLAVSPLGR